MAYVFSKKIKITAFLCLTLFVLLSLGIIFLLTQKNFFQKKIYYTCILKTSAFLKQNSEVIMNGFQIGNIKSVKLTQNNLVEVRFFIYEKYKSYIKQNAKIFPLRSLSKSMLIIEVPQNSNSPEIMPNTILHGTQNQNIDYSMYSAVDANTSIDTLAFNIDSMAKGFINPNYGIKAIYSNMLVLKDSLTEDDYLLVNYFLTNKQMLQSIEKIIKYTSSTITNTEQITKDIMKLSSVYSKKRQNIYNIKNNLNYTYVSMQKIINELSSNETNLKEISGVFSSLSNSAYQRGRK